jgi:hypothetical protein
MELNLVSKIMVKNLAILLIFLGLSIIFGQTLKTSSVQARQASVLSQ